MDVRRALIQLRCYWYPIMLQLHRFVVAISRVSVDHGGRGGTELIRWCGIRGVVFSIVSLVFGLMSTLLLSLGLLVLGFLPWRS